MHEPTGWLCSPPPPFRGRQRSIMPVTRSCGRPRSPASRGESRMDDTVRKITAEDISPRFNWGRHLPALGTMGVDFEERVDYRRLHRYRLARVRQALEKSDLGALLVFDVNNIRYITSTKIGE